MKQNLGQKVLLELQKLKARPEDPNTGNFSFYFQKIIIMIYFQKKRKKVIISILSGAL